MSVKWNLSALCRCCHADGATKSLQALYVHDGATEIYAELFRETFGILIDVQIKSLTFEPSYGICDCCIDQLRLAHRFKKQVLACETKFKEYFKRCVIGGLTTLEPRDGGQAGDKKLEVCYSDSHAGRRVTRFSSGLVFEVEVGPLHIESETKTKTTVPPLVDDVNTDDVEFKECFDGANEGEEELSELYIIESDTETEATVSPPVDDVNTDDVKTKECVEQSTDDGEENGDLDTVPPPVDDVNSDGVETEECFEYGTDDVEKNGYLDTAPPPVDNVKSDGVKTEECFEDSTDDGEENGELDTVTPPVNDVNTDDVKTEEYFEDGADNDGKVTKTRSKNVKKKLRCTCDFCNEQFTSKSDLHDHYTDNHIPDDFSCTLCNLPFEGRKGLLKHLMLEHENYCCQFCTETFTMLNTLKQHEHSHSKDGFVCDYCQKVFKLKDSLIQHICLHMWRYKKYGCKICGIKCKCTVPEKQKRPFKCELCDKTYTLRKHLVIHLKSHTVCGIGGLNTSQTRDGGGDMYLVKGNKELDTKSKMVTKATLPRPVQDVKTEECFKNGVDDGGKPKQRRRRRFFIAKFKFTCDFCNELFSIKTNLRNHFIDKHIPDDFSCTLCNLPFKERNALVKHLMFKHENEKHYCQYCIETFTTLNALRKHESSHTKDGFVCDYCQKVIKCKANLTKHISVVHFGIFDKFVCKTCGFVTKQKHSLQFHIQCVHDKLRPFKCDLCEKAFALKKSLVIHKRCHTGEKPFMCNLCHKDYASHDMLRVHYNHTHAKDKRIYVCDYCKKVCTWKKGLKDHIIKHHMGKSEEYVCELCGHAYSYLPSLKKHVSIVHDKQMNRHTGTDEKFVCEACGRAFTNKFYMKRHMETVHNKLKPFKCDLCDKTFTRKEHMKNHYRRIHTGETNLLCPKANVYKSRCTVHNARKHINIYAKDFKGYVCDYCLTQINKYTVFSRKDSLIQHINKHRYYN